MLQIDVSVIDDYGKNRFARIRAVRGAAHSKFPQAFYYEWVAKVDGKTYDGSVLHSYNNGGIALTVKISKALLNQIKKDRV